MNQPGYHWGIKLVQVLLGTLLLKVTMRINNVDMQDDLVDDVQSFVAAAEVLKERGAYKIYVMATHGLLSSDAPRLIEDSPIDEVSDTFTVLAAIQILSLH